MRIFDHASIYLLIVGSYSPFVLILLKGSNRALALFVAVWVMAIAGIVLKIMDMNRFKKICMLLYLLMGWLALLDIRNIAVGLGVIGTALLFAGGASYTIGIIFYKMI